MRKILVKVRFFDALNGMGEGESPDGRTVFLNSKNIVKDGRFVTLNLAEEMTCEIEESNGKLFAQKILRSRSTEFIESDASDSFIEPENLNL